LKHGTVPHICMFLKSSVSLNSTSSETRLS
jgi:hypothetical protein